MSYYGNPHKEDRRAAALADCCQRLERGEPLESCLLDYPLEYWDELSSLAPIGSRIRRLASDPSPDFQARLHQQVLESVVGARRRREAGALAGIRAAMVGWVGSLATGQALSSLPARIMAIVVVAVLVLGSAGAGVVQASDESLPDSPLYQVKAAREWVETVAARDNQARTGVSIRQAGRRTIELSLAIRSGKPRPVVAILVNRLDAATTRLVEDAQESKAQNNHQAVNRALTALRAIRSQVEQMSTQATPGQNRPLQRLHASLLEKERRLIEIH